jgi:hypothetical protein
MIIKGGSRAAPGQLARHLQRRDTNENVEILELQSPAPDLAEAFRDWQTLTEGTRGHKGLYHANIDPAKGYTMTPDQWQRAVDVLEKELKLDGQPRAVVLHEKHGREHIHVVWARTDIDEMTLRSDSQNYQAHERASQKLEIEFGHEHVPGKHAKRDREKQPEFPRADANQAEWQQGERTGIDPATRKEQITALKQACDNGQTFRNALEEQGYILAKGDRRDFVIVDEAGSIHSLGRQIQDMKAAELRAFMNDVDRESLPTAVEAVEQQRQHQETSRKESAPPETAKEPTDVQAETLREAFAARQAEDQRRLLEKQDEELNRLHDALVQDNRERLGRFAALQREAAEKREDQLAAGTPRGMAAIVRAVQDFLQPEQARERQEQEARDRKEFVEQQGKERDDYIRFQERAADLAIEDLKDVHALHREEFARKGDEELDRHIRELEAEQKLRAEIEEQERQRLEELVKSGLERPPPTRAK